MANTLQQRLLRDIAELQENPYPNIYLRIRDDDFTKGCLVLATERYGSLHMTVEFPNNYPLSPPRIRMNTRGVDHPNIFGDYICASILNTVDGYTPAYTLKSIAIQMLSFFGSDSLEQVGGGTAVNLDTYRQSHIIISPALDWSFSETTPRSDYICVDCGSGMPSKVVRLPFSSRMVSNVQPNGANIAHITRSISPLPLARIPGREDGHLQRARLPDEVLLLICESLSAEDLMAFAQSWSRIGRVLTTFDVIRTRELQCFCLKKDYKSATLGIGVNVVFGGKIGTFSSEFDLLSNAGFFEHHIRRSVHGLPFQYWLALPISYGHWKKVRGKMNDRLAELAVAARLGNVAPVQVIYSFMNEVVVKLNQSAAQLSQRSSSYHYQSTSKSTLTHASEKAVESYFHLYHLLLCLATEQPWIVQDANRQLQAFADGATSKSQCPNLGSLLVASLISDLEMDVTMLRKIIKEATIRNVVWMLDPKGANMPELSYLEPSSVSHYRLKKTFEASTTSYRLLMFLNLFRTTAVGSPRKSLPQLRDEAFERHGAPPRGSAKRLADDIKSIHKVSNFPDFLRFMGVEPQSAEGFTTFLRSTVEVSIEKGYSTMPISQDQALWFRQKVEANVEVRQGVSALPYDHRTPSFFPAKSGNKGAPQHDRGGRGRGRGRGGFRGRGNWRG